MRAPERPGSRTPACGDDDRDRERRDDQHDPLEVDDRARDAGVGPREQQIALVREEQPPPLWAFAALTLLAGGPAVVGLWVGSLAFAPQWSALALAVGAGAILQVVGEVTMLLRRGGAPSGALISPAAVAGLACGVGVMYLTAMLVKI